MIFASIVSKSRRFLLSFPFSFGQELKHSCIDRFEDRLKIRREETLQEIDTSLQKLNSDKLFIKRNIVLNKTQRNATLKVSKITATSDE